MRRAAARGPRALAWLALAVLVSGMASASDPPLVDAARRGDLAMVEDLLARGADVSESAGDGMTALHWAAAGGHGAVLRTLLEAGADATATTRIGGHTPLHVASRAGQGAAVAALLDSGADPNRPTTGSGATALHLAAGAIGGQGAVRALLEAGADPNRRERSAGQTPIMFAAAAGRTDAVAQLLARGANPSSTTTVVDVLEQVALDREASRRFRDMLGASRASEDPEYEDEEEAALDREPSPGEVQEAIRAQRRFLRSGYDVGEADWRALASTRPDYPGGPDLLRPPYREVLVGKTGGMTALLFAAREGHVEVARRLLEGGADVDQASADRTSPLLIATLNGQFDVAMLLLEAGADPNIVASSDGVGPLFAVLQTQWAPKSNYPQPRAHDTQGTDYLDVLGALLQAGADPNVRLNTHLWYWEFGLTKMGIDLTGATPLWRAAFAQDVEAMNMLVSHGADPNIPTRWPAVGMRERRQQDGRQQEDSGLPWIPEGEPNAYPLHAAAGGGYTGLGAFSVRNVPDQFLSAVRYLVEEQGADVNLRDSWLYTPLHYAASRGDDALIEYLVARGADVAAITRLGQSTADLARGGRSGFFTRVAYPRTVELLTSLGATLRCLHTHFLDTGDFCAGAGVGDPWAGHPGASDVFRALAGEKGGAESR